MGEFFTERNRITIDGPSPAGTTPINSTALDMAGWDGVLFIVRLGSPAANNNIRAQQDVVSGMTGAADLAGTLVNSATENVHMLDLKRPGERFVRCVVTRGTTTTVDTVVAIQYRGRKAPAVQPAGVLEQWQSPAEGTA